MSPLENYILIQQHSVICFLVSEAEIYSTVLKQYGGKCIICANFNKWIDYFKDGRTSTTDEQQPG